MEYNVTWSDPADDGNEWVQESFRENYRRLQQIKKQYDPMNLFRVNANIPPAD